MTKKTIDNSETIEALVSIMDELTTRQLELKSQLKLVEQEIEKYEYQMQEILKQENKEVITCGYWSFGWDIKQRTTFNQKEFKEAHPDLYEKFKTTSEVKRFCFGHKEK